MDYFEIIKSSLLPTSFLCYNVAMLLTKHHRNFIHGLYRHWQYKNYSLNFIMDNAMYKINNRVIIDSIYRTNQNTIYSGNHAGTTENLSGKEMLEKLKINIKVHPETMYTVKKYYFDNFYVIKKDDIVIQIDNDKNNLIEKFANKKYGRSANIFETLAYFTGLTGLLVRITDRRYMD